MKKGFPPERPDQSSPFIEAFRVLSQMTTAVSLMLLPAGLGYLLDQWLGITFFSLSGMTAGVYLGIQHLLRIGDASETTTTSSTSKKSAPPTDLNQQS